MRLNGGEWLDIAEIVSTRPLSAVTKDETPADATQKPWMCWEEKPGQWLSWCGQCVDLNKVEEHIHYCKYCTETFRGLCRKIEIHP